jgi:ligand-binding SRPBCC domain-containing protein
MLPKNLQMAVYVLKAVQKLPVDMDTAWDFFTRPGNLQRITPKEMKFIITTPFTSDKAYPGEIITYRVSPVAGIPLTWVTEITQLKSKEYFVDEQRFGPYSMWHHEHHFKTIDGGVEMTDVVYYKIPFWFIGDIAHTLFIKNKLKQIFTFRFQKIDELFGRWKDGELNTVEFYKS